MKRIPLTQNKFALVDDRDYLRVSAFKWHLRCHHGHEYATTRLDKSSKIDMHRLIMLAVKGEVVDHKNRNGLDNRRVNLRSCTPHQNLMNSGLSKNNKSGYKGVSWHKDTRNKKKWRAVITFNGKQFFLGHFYDPKKAHKAYVRKAKELFGEFHRSA